VLNQCLLRRFNLNNQHWEIYMNQNVFDQIKQNAFDDELSKISSELKGSSKLEKIALIMGYGRANPSDYGTIAGTNGRMQSQVPNKKRGLMSTGVRPPDNTGDADYNAMSAATKNRFTGVQRETNATHAHVRPEQPAPAPAPAPMASAPAAPVQMPAAQVRPFKQSKQSVGNLNVDVVAQGGMQNNKLPLKRWDIGMNERPSGRPAPSSTPQAPAKMQEMRYTPPQNAQTAPASKPGFFSREGTQQRMAANNARKFGGGSAPAAQMASAPMSGWDKNKQTIAMAGWGSGARARPAPAAQQSAPSGVSKAWHGFASAMTAVPEPGWGSFGKSKTQPSGAVSAPKPGFFSREATQARMASNNARRFGGGNAAPAGNAVASAPAPQVKKG
jgi:hypothetical protein